MSEFQIPESVIAEFGQPQHWAVCLVDTTVPEVEHWRTLAYTGVLRALENNIRDAGGDIHSGEWRIYELDEAAAARAVAAFPNGEDDLEGLKVALAVARGVTDAP